MFVIGLFYLHFRALSSFCVEASGDEPTENKIDTKQAIRLKFYAYFWTLVKEDTFNKKSYIH